MPFGEWTDRISSNFILDPFLDHPINSDDFILELALFFSFSCNSYADAIISGVKISGEAAGAIVEDIVQAIAGLLCG